MRTTRLICSFTAIVSVFALAACKPVTKGPIPGEDPIVGKWHASHFGMNTFTSQGTFLPDPRFGERCADVPQVRVEKQKCAAGAWQSLGDGSYAILVPNFTTEGQDGAHDCQCNGNLEVVGHLHGNTLELGAAGGPTTITMDRR
jgi:hypothetical protein